MPEFLFCRPVLHSYRSRTPIELRLTRIELRHLDRFVREHPMLKVKPFPKWAPNLNPVERLANGPLKSALCTNRFCLEVDDVIGTGRGSSRNSNGISELGLVKLFCSYDIQC